MKALFFNLPFSGHVNPTLPLVAELVRRGDSITYFTSRAYQDLVESTGADFINIGDDVRVDLSHDTNILVGARRLLEPVSPALERLLPKLRADPPDYILHDTQAVWGAYLAALLGVPAITSVPTVVFSRRLTRSSLRWAGPVVRHPATSVREFVRFQRIATRLASDYQLPRPRILRVFGMYGPLNIVYTSRAFQPYADEIDDRFKFVGRLLDTHETHWDPMLEGLGDRPIVYVSLGTVVNNRPDFFRTAFNTLAALDCDVIVTVGRTVDPGSLGTPPPNVRVARWVDQLAVLQRSALAICHGGMGTITDSLYFGVPMIVVPHFGEQFWNAARVEELGAGIQLQTAQVSEERLRSLAAHILTTPSYAAASRRLGDTLRDAGGHVRAADEIQAYVRRSAATLPVA